MHHKDSVTQALLDLFPEIGLEKSKMSPYSMFLVSEFAFIYFYLFYIYLFPFLGVWHDFKARRRYFENYANEQGFDPLNAEGWQSQPLEKILAAKVLFAFLLFP